MKREPWKPLAWKALPDITLGQAHSIIMAAGFRMGLVEARKEGEGDDTKITLYEHPHVSHDFWHENLLKGIYLPWNTHHWLAEGFYEKAAARLAADLSRGLSG